MNIYVAGIGGLGVLTIGALLGSAAHADGLTSSVLDFTGLSQKNGSVVSQVRIAPPDAVIHAVRIADGEADLLLGCDAVVSVTAEALRKFAAGTGAAVINTEEVPTSDFVRDRDNALPMAHMIDAVMSCAGERGFLARWGGDEFAMLFPSGMSAEAVTGILADVLADFDEMPPLGSTLLKIGATCGVAQMDTPASSEEIMRRADLALYRGKEAGRGSVVCWDHQIEARQSERQRAIAQLRSALNDGRALAAYQPIVELESGRVVSVEALLRLRDTSGQLLSASDVFAALLDPELSRRVSRVMLDAVVADGPAILALFGPETRIGLNLSEADLRQGDFVRHLIEVIDDSALSPRNITIEVTETMLLDAGGQLRASLAMLDDCGFTICLDDFGTGFSSLTHLRAFPIHKVKIDRDFIAAIAEDHQSRLIIQAIVQMGHSLGLRVVVEGVETEEQETFLRAIGCPHVQGYRYGRPALLPDMQATFAERAEQQRRRA